MFALRGVAVSLSVYVLVYLSLCLVIVATWRVLARRRSLVFQVSATGIFALRLFPVVVAGGVTLGLAVPSFLLLEPHSAREAIGWVPFFLGLSCLALIATGVLNVTSALMRTSRIVSSWMKHATAVVNAPVPMFQTENADAPLVLAGIHAPKVIVSGTAAAALNENELQVAIRHEIAHIRHRDNLKKLLLRFCAFPGMKALDAAWSEAAELCADNQAVASTVDALELASALIKLSRLAPAAVLPGLTTPLADGSAASLNTRVERLISWDKPGETTRYSRTFWMSMAAIVSVLVTIVVSYGTLLKQIHELTEFMVR